MITRPDIDPEMLDLVRRADPMLDPRVQADAGLDTESALRLLAPELARPLAAQEAPDARRSRQRRPRALRVAALAVAVVAVGFAAANLASTGNDSAVSPAQAKELIKHASAALIYPPNAILEEDITSTVTGPDGTNMTSEVHQWLSTSPPFDNRMIMIQNGQVQWEQATANHQLTLYDPSTNTVYAPSAVAPQLVPDDPNENSGLAEVHYLLGQHSAIGHVTVDPNAVLDGQRAVEFTSDNGRFSYWASSTDYRPLQSVDREDQLPTGQAAVGTDRYPIERVLTGAAATPNLLALQAQHPDATVDHSSADYQAAWARLFHAPLNPNAPASRRRR
jgi:hypothetical protein